MTSASDLRRDSDALAALTALKDQLPGDYLIVGPHASYAYHHWMFPIAKMIHLRIRADDLEKWPAVLGEPWTVRASPPTSDDARGAVRLAILEIKLTDALLSRRRVINGLTYISPEDLCVELLKAEKSQILISEVAALLVSQRQKLDWDYLCRQVVVANMGERLTRIIETTNHEAGRALLPLPPFAASYASATPLPEFPQPYTRFDQPWHVKRSTIAKVLMDLRAKWKGSDERATVR